MNPSQSGSITQTEAVQIFASAGARRAPEEQMLQGFMILR